MSQKMALKFGLLRERFIRPMTTFPATVVSCALGAVNRRHVSRNQVLLQRAGIRKSGTTRGLYSVDCGSPFANMQLGVCWIVLRTGQDRRGTALQWGRGLSRTGHELRTNARAGLTRIRGVMSIWMNMLMRMRFAPMVGATGTATALVGGRFYDVVHAEVRHMEARRRCRGNICIRFMQVVVTVLILVRE